MVYTTIEDVEKFMRTTYDANSSPDRETVLEYITDVDSDVDDDTGTTWTLTTDSLVFNLDNPTCEFIVDKLPVDSITTVYKNTNPSKYETPVWEDITSDLWVSEANLVLTQNGYEGINALKINFVYGYDGASSLVKKLATRMVAREIMSGDDTANNQFETTRIGPIDVKRNIGTARFLNIDSDIKSLRRKLGSFKKFSA